MNASTNQLSGYAYDANGNQISTGYGYDAENRIVSANAGGTQYFYDAQNKRVWQGNFTSGYLVGETVTMFGADGKMIATYGMNLVGTVVSFNTAPARVYFGGKLVAYSTPGQTPVAVLQDRLGSVGKYYPYGEERNAPQLGNDQVKFATYTRDSATGNDYADQRYYSSALGRFMTPDPSSQAAKPTSPQTWNKFAYANADPVNLHDPRGLCSFDEAGAYYDDDSHSTMAFPGPCADGLIGDGAQTVNAIDIEYRDGVFFLNGNPIAEASLREDYAFEFTIASLTQSVFSLFRSTGGAHGLATGASVWTLGNVARGYAVEEMLAGADLLPAGFPGIDAVADGVATSIKSVNLGDVTYQTTSGLQSTLMRYVNNLIDFMGKLEDVQTVNYNGGSIAYGDISHWVLQVAIPGAPTAAQQAAIAAAADYAALNGIQFVTTIIP